MFRPFSLFLSFTKHTCEGTATRCLFLVNSCERYPSFCQSQIQWWNHSGYQRKPDTHCMAYFPTFGWFLWYISPPLNMYELIMFWAPFFSRWFIAHEPRKHHLQIHFQKTIRSEKARLHKCPFSCNCCSCNLNIHWKINMEPKNHPIKKENHVPNLHFWVPCFPGCNLKSTWHSLQSPHLGCFTNPLTNLPCGIYGPSILTLR